MELIKNKASGKIFVVLDDTGGPDLLVITPEGKIRCLERHLFDPQEVDDSTEDLLRCQLTKKQADIYTEYLGE